MRLFSLAIVFLFASCVGAVEMFAEDINTTSGQVKISYETDFEASYAGDARTKLGGNRTGNVSAQYDLARIVASPQWNEGPLYRFGLEYQRASFGLPKAAPLPNTLQGISAIAGVDFQLFESWLVRMEAQPGFYSASTDIRGKDFNVPFIIGGSYIAGADLQWILGVSVDFNRRYPVIPAIGVRWKFADKWVLNAVLPSPRLEFLWNKGVTLYAGADIKDGTYRASRTFGDAHGKRGLNDAIVEYEEIRVGLGGSWKITPGVTLEIEGGYLPYRDLNFHRSNSSFRTESGAAYGQVSAGGRF